MSLKKKLLAIPVVGVLGVLAFPLANLVAEPDNTKLLPKRLDGVPQWGEVRAVLGKKCVHCHAAEPELPFYASLPIAKGMVQKDLRQGRAIFDAPEELVREGSPPVSEAALAKLEFTLANDSMPPTRYLLLHWNHTLGDDEKALLLDWVAAVRKQYFTTPGVAKAHATGPLQPLPTELKLDPAKVALGRDLFHDKRLSGDQTLSCASCHGLDKGGTDQRRFSVGIRDQVGPINSPTVFNSAHQIAQFWDGRARDLADQAGGPVESPIEMGAKWPQVLARLRQDEALVRRMKAAYADGVTADNVKDAIATFEKSLVTPSRFDRFLRGEEKALSKREKAGFYAFVKHGCAMCHVGKALGGQSFEKMGLYESYFSGRKITEADHGRYNVTKRAYDKHRFKVPLLRNIALTAPYFHDGSTKDLGTAISTMSTHQLEDRIPAKALGDIEAFLRSLTGTYQGKPLK